MKGKIKINTNPLEEDLDHILLHTKGLWKELCNKNIFITGGSGFFGCWLLESFAWANDKLKLNASAVVLTRNPEAFKRRSPHLYNHKAIKFLKGDIKDFVFPKGSFSYLIHSCGYQQAAEEKVRNVSMANDMLKGTTRVLDFCVKAKIKKMLLVSTGAVYGRAPSKMKKIPEDFSAALDPTSSKNVYQQVRRMMETMAVIYAKENDFEAKIARCFSFIGPYLPLNGRFAVSDFILDAFSRRNITVKSDGKAVRSYLYMSDLVVWLWTILFRGENYRPYNVGSEMPITISEVAKEFAKETVPSLSVSILKKSSGGVAPDYYVPDTTRARTELNLKQRIPFTTSVKKTMQWHKDTN